MKKSTCYSFFEPIKLCYNKTQEEGYRDHKRNTNDLSRHRFFA